MWFHGTLCLPLCPDVLVSLIQLWGSVVVPEPSAMLRVQECVSLLLNHRCMLSCFGPVRLFVTLWTATCQAPVHGILQAGILEWLAVPSSRDLHNPGIEPASLKSTCIGRQVLYTSATWETVGSLILATVGIFTLWNLAKATKSGLRIFWESIYQHTRSLKSAIWLYVWIS